MRARLTILIGCAAFALALPANAMASQVSLSGGDTWRFFAGPAEANDVTVSVVGSDVVFADPAAPVTPVAPCMAITPNSVRCPLGPATITAISVELNDLGDKALLDPSVPDFERISMSGGGGDDKITALGAAAISASGGAGVDELAGGSGGDRLSGDGEVDTISGNAGRDSITGGDGADMESGGEGNDDFEGGSSADGADLISGGPGEDVMSYRSRVADLSISLDDVANDGQSGEGDNVGADVENLEPGSGNDVVIGSEADNEIQNDLGGNDIYSGAGGDDELNTGEGNDVVSGGPGADVIFDNVGSDSLSGGEGDDRLSGQFGDRLPDTISGGAGLDSYTDFSLTGLTVSMDGVADDGPTDPAVGPRNDNVGADIENLEVPGPGNDTLTGNDSANEIEGNAGEDVIAGLGGADAIFGGDGSDTLDAGAGSDLLDSGGGVDRLRSRDGEADEVACGSSTDTLLADSLDQFPVTCDLASSGPYLTKLKAKLNGRDQAKVPVSCPAVEGIDCLVTVEVRRGGKAIARGRGTVGSGETAELKLKLTDTGEKAAKKADRLKGTATTKMIDATGVPTNTFEPKFTLVL